MAKAQGVSSATVQRIWDAHGLKPHRVKTFKLSNDPRFTEMTHDCKRNGTTTLFAALNTLDGSVGQCLPRHRHQEFLKFLRTLDREFPGEMELHLIVDNYRTHKHANVNAWLQKHPGFTCTSPQLRARG